MSIYEKIGGAPSVAAAVDDFYRRVLGDPDLVPYFEGVDVDRLRAVTPLEGEIVTAALSP